MWTHLPLLQNSQSNKKIWPWWFGCIFILTSACTPQQLNQNRTQLGYKTSETPTHLEIQNHPENKQQTQPPDIQHIKTAQTDDKTKQIATSTIEEEQPQTHIPPQTTVQNNESPSENQTKTEIKPLPEREPYPESPAQALRKITTPPKLFDDLWEEALTQGKSFEEAKQPLIEALQNNIQFLERSPKHQTFLFGNRVFSKEEYLNHGLRRFLEIIQNSSDPESIATSIEKEFDFYESYGYYDKKKKKDWGWGHVKITGYYEPILEASTKPNHRFYQALYRRPPDLQNTSVIWYGKDAQDCSSQLSRGKLVTKASKKRSYVCKVQFSRLIRRKNKKKWNWVPAPYYTRQQIDNRGVLKKHHLELCYVDRLDAYLLQIEGSGRVRLSDGTTFRVRVNGQNGLPHQAYSRRIIELASKAKMSVEEYLRSLSKPKLSNFLNQNLSYVFFEENNNGVNTSMGVEMTPGRTVAMDQRIFPRGSLIFILGKKPVFSGEEDQKPISWKSLNRWALIQDTGGAIRGAGRVDLFLGEGPTAKRQADLINHPGTILFLVPKEKESTPLM